MTSARDYCRAVNPNYRDGPDTKPKPENYAHPDDYTRALRVWKEEQCIVSTSR